MNNLFWERLAITIIAFILVVAPSFVFAKTVWLGYEIDEDAYIYLTDQEDFRCLDNQRSVMLLNKETMAFAGCWRMASEQVVEIQFIGMTPAVFSYKIFRRVLQREA